MPGKGIRGKERQLIIRLFRSGLTCREISDTVGRPASTLRQALVRWGERTPKKGKAPPRHLPTPKEIEAARKTLRPVKTPMPTMSPDLVEMLIGKDETHDRYSTRKPDQALESRGG